MDNINGPMWQDVRTWAGNDAQQAETDQFPYDLVDYWENEGGSYDRAE